VKAFLSFCCNQPSAAAAAEKLGILCEPQAEDPATRVLMKRQFELQLDFLLAEAWHQRCSVQVAAVSASPAAAPGVPLYGNYAPSNTISMGGYSPTFAPVVNVTLPQPQPVKAAEVPRHVQKHVPPEAGMQNSVLAYFPQLKGAEASRAPVNLKDATDVEVLHHFGLAPQERANQRSDFLNNFIANEARGQHVHAVLDKNWRDRVSKLGKDAYDSAVKEGKLILKDRGVKKKKRAGPFPSSGDSNGPTAQEDGDEELPGEEELSVRPKKVVVHDSSRPAAPGDEEELLGKDESTVRPRKIVRSFAPESAAAAVPTYDLSSEDLINVRLADLNKKRVAQRPAEDDKRLSIGDEGASEKKRKADSAIVKAPDYTKMTKSQLHVLLKEQQLPIRGKKEELVKRLQAGDENKIRAQRPPKDKGEADSEPMVDALSGNLLPMGSGEDKNGEGSEEAMARRKLDDERRNDVRGRLSPPLAQRVDFIRGNGFVRLNEVVVAKYDDKLQRCTVTHLRNDDSDLFGCHFFNVEETVWIAGEDLMSLPIPRSKVYRKGHFVLFCEVLASKQYRIAQLREDCNLSISGSEVKIFKSRLDGPTNYVHLQDYETCIIKKLRPHDVIFDLLESDDELGKDDILGQNLLFLGVRLGLIRSPSAPKE
jgi:hypothetical protein